MMPRMKDIQVVVMMGGAGSRLGDIVASCPKPLLPVGESLPAFRAGKPGETDKSSGLCKQKQIPFFEYELRLLIVAGFRRFLFCTGYLSNEIEDYFGDGKSNSKMNWISDFGRNITHSITSILSFVIILMAQWL